MFDGIFENRELLVNFISGLGPLGPLAYIALQILQTVVAPIPGNVVGAIGGYLFGWWGVIWTSIGATLGAAIVFWLSRRFGRKLVERFVKPDIMKKFDFILNNRRAGTILFLIFLIPGLPDDAVCYLAGLTKIPIKQLIVLFAIGRLPAVVVNNYVGDGLGEGNLTTVFIIVAVTAVLLAIIYWQQENIMNLLSRLYKTDDRKKIVKKAREDLDDDGELNNSIAKKSKKS